MKGLKRAAILTALALPPLAAQAHFKPLSESAMRATTGQGGLTIEMQTELNIDQIKYTDQGSINVNNVHLGGATANTPLDNMTWTLDIAGQGELLNYGFSQVAAAASDGTLQASDRTDPNVLWAQNHYASSGSSYGRQFDGGDLVLHLGPTDPSAYTSLNGFENAIDFGLNIGGVETQGVGAYSSNRTSMFSNINIQGYLGPTDIFVHNGDGSDIALANGVKVSNQYIDLNSYFKISKMDLNWNAADVILLFNFAAVQIRGMTITSSQNGQFGYANVSAKIGRATSTPSGHTGLAIFDASFQGDINMPQFLIGGNSIGSIKFNNFTIRNTNLVVYGH